MEPLWVENIVRHSTCRRKGRRGANIAVLAVGEVGTQPFWHDSPFIAAVVPWRSWLLDGRTMGPIPIGASAASIGRCSSPSSSPSRWATPHLRWGTKYAC
jgi:hypothetical protein